MFIFVWKKNKLIGIRGKNVAMKLRLVFGTMPLRRLTELSVAILLAFPIAVLLALLFVIVVPLQGRPFLYASERMRGVGEPFFLFKIRTMHPPDAVSDQCVLGGDNASRVTGIGRFLRKTRLDELPQIFNVIRGDMSFIGPRPPLRRYVEAYPALYADVLQDRPGITGLATVMLHRREEQLLAACETAHETDQTYRQKCIAPKARLDRFYRTNRSLGMDLWILWLTISRVIPRVPAAFRQDLATSRRRDRGELGILIRDA